MKFIFSIVALSVLYISSFSQSQEEIDSLYRKGSISVWKYKKLKAKLDGKSVKPHIERIPYVPRKYRYFISIETGPIYSLMMNYTLAGYFGRKQTKKPGEGYYWGLEISQGLNIKDKYKIGFGSGILWYRNKQSIEGTYFPFYLDFSYRPVKGNISPIVIQKIGSLRHYLWYAHSTDYLNKFGTYYNSGLGLSMRLRNQKMLNLIIGYELIYVRKNKKYVFPNVNTTNYLKFINSSLGVKLAFTF